MEKLHQVTSWVISVLIHIALLANDVVLHPEIIPLAVGHVGVAMSRLNVVPSITMHLVDHGFVPLLVINGHETLVIGILWRGSGSLRLFNDSLDSLWGWGRGNHSLSRLLREVRNKCAIAHYSFIDINFRDHSFFLYLIDYSWSSSGAANDSARTPAHLGNWIWRT